MMIKAVNAVLGRIGLRLARADTFRHLHQIAHEADCVPSVYGHRMYFDPLDQGIGLSSLNEAPVQGGEAKFITRSLRPGQTVVDVGANIGLMTMLMARAVGPSGKVFAFEPGPRSFYLLQKNIRANGYTNVTAERAAVADNSGETELQVCGTGESDNRLRGVAADPRGYYTVKTKVVVLDEYLKGQRIDFVKIDAQGSEYRILKGLRRTVSENPQIRIVAEYGPGWIEAAGVPADEFFGLIESMELDMVDLPDDGPEMPVDRRWLTANVGGADRPQINLLLRRR
jgi:FkbM family methyltransferase